MDENKKKNDIEYIEADKVGQVDGTNNLNYESNFDSNENKGYKKEDLLKEGKNKVKNGFGKCKKVLFSIIALIVVSGVVAGGIAFKTIKDSEKYTLDQAQKIALEQVKGTIVKSEREIDDLHVEYEFKIKDQKNMIQKVTVDGETGAIIKISNPSNED